MRKFFVRLFIIVMAISALLIGANLLVKRGFFGSERTAGEVAGEARPATTVIARQRSG